MENLERALSLVDALIMINLIIIDFQAQDANDVEMTQVRAAAAHWERQVWWVDIGLYQVLYLGEERRTEDSGSA